MPVIRFLCLLLVATLASAEEQNGYWELGAGLSWFRTPDYLGSDQSENYVLPYPHIVVRTKRFSIYDENVRGHLLSTDRFKFDISFSGALKVESEDNRLRRDMPDLDYQIEVGPAVKWLLAGSFNDNDSLTLDLPARAVVATDFNGVDYIGWRFLPTLHWHKVIQGDVTWLIDNRLSLQYATKDYHDYLYSVDAPYVTPQRDFYQAQRGFSGWQYRFTLRHRRGDRIIGLYLAYHNIADAAYNGSPLVAENYNISGGFFITWVLGRGTF